MDNLKSIIETLLFVSDTPLSVNKIISVLEATDRKTVIQALTELGEEYDQQQRAFFISEVAEGFQLRTRPQFAEWVRKLKQTKPPRLSRAAMETLAIIAYKQPVMRTDVELLRGVDCGGVVRMLLERGIIRVLGRKDLPGRPMVYGTSKRFLEMFDLKDLKNLPTLKDIQELGEIAPVESEDLIEAYEEEPMDFIDDAMEEPIDATDPVEPGEEPVEDSFEEEQLEDSSEDGTDNPIQSFGEAWQNGSN